MAAGWPSVACGAGTRYRYRVADGVAVPDPASRRKRAACTARAWWSIRAPTPGVHTAWQGRPWHEAVLYELHAGLLGGFRGRDGTVAAPRVARRDRDRTDADRCLSRHAQLGLRRRAALTRRTHPYGTPDELKALIDAAHGLGLMVFLDVVYNHFGPDGNYLHAYATAVLPHRRGDALGRGDRFPPGRRCASSSSTTRSTGWMSTASTACASMPCTRSPRPDGAAGAGRGDPSRRGRTATCTWCWSTTATPRASCAPDRANPRRRLPFRRAMGGRLPPLLHRAADRRGRRLLRRLSRTRGAARTLPCRGLRLAGRDRPPIAAASRAASRARTCRRRPSSRSCRTTTRSATALSATG